MQPISVIAVFDIGKTNKKLFLFNEQYEIVWERSANPVEIVDEDGFPCEDLDALISWLHSTLGEAFDEPRFDIKALNFSTYGASLVHVDQEGIPLAPLYNYLKPFPGDISQKFFADYGPEDVLTRSTASPSLGSLNSGLQLYRIKLQKPELFKRIVWSLHLPQYVSSVFTHQFYTDITSIGCHTALWNFDANNYHLWAVNEGIVPKLAPLVPSDRAIVTKIAGRDLKCGVGLHDSSAALIPYLMKFDESFLLISTGTWNISLHPFNKDPLTADELKQDCLCYFAYDGRQVKASRLFAGYQHEQAVKKMNEHFGAPLEYYKGILFNAATLKQWENVSFSAADLSSLPDYASAYHVLLNGIVEQQVQSTNLVLEHAPVKRIFVDGGFSRNPVFMKLLAHAYPKTEVYAASVAQASALGAALAIHEHWNTSEIPERLILLKKFDALDLS